MAKLMMDASNSKPITLPEANWPSGVQIPHYPRVCASFHERTPLLRFVLRASRKHSIKDPDEFIIADATMLHLHRGDESMHGLWQDIEMEQVDDWIEIRFHPNTAAESVRLPQAVFRTLHMIQKHRLLEFSENGYAFLLKTRLQRRTICTGSTYGMGVLSIILGMFSANPVAPFINYQAFITITYVVGLLMILLLTSMLIISHSA